MYNLNLPKELTIKEIFLQDNLGLKIMDRVTYWAAIGAKKLNFLCYVPTFGQIELLKTNISIWNFVVSPNWKLKCCIKVLKHLNKFHKQRSLDYDEKH